VRRGLRRCVSKIDDGARTQNGHIRNDTRDASRPVLAALIGPICRKNCVAMVRRGSTVRVRQRTLQKRRSRGFSVQEDLLLTQRAVGMERFMEL
jgi:hypothetical protein